MLKRLELVGFKSFADKTQFDFTGGVTAIVGPNGSGKSNIVDAVRWILGEQSAKSLRGGEMADVIFNGSTSRRSLGLAEVTMTFDNSRHVLGTDAEEVQITRRVYRDGEGEYLINQQVCRLKDIKELFLGSGAGADAYCIIEQGKVDVLLQYSTKERRTIFEEAAGISRFKAKKIETIRKLERVDQNVQRLKDIIEEVEKQLRSVKLQAAKAQRYQEYSSRLKELRVHLGLDEYKQLSERFQAETAVLERLKADLAERALQADTWEADTRRLEEAIVQLDAAAHDQENRLADARQQIAAEGKTLEHEQSLSTQLEADLVSTRGRMTELSSRVGALEESVAQAALELHGVECQDQEHRETVRRLEEELQAVVERLALLHRQKQEDHDNHLEQMRQKSRLENDVNLYKAQIENLSRERQRLLHRTEQAAGQLTTLDSDLAELTRADESLQARLGAARQAVADQRQERERLHKLHDETTQTLSDLKAQRSGLTSRIEVLEGLERSHEGLGTGVREVLALREQPEAGPWSTVIGMIADVLTVRREYAPLIDLALGDLSQHFLVRDAQVMIEALQQRGQPLSGRVSFLPVHRNAPSRDAESSERSADPSILRADQLVTCDNPELAGLPAQLLGKTLIVRDLAAARELAARFPDHRLLTLQGELLEPDGTLTVGTHHAETGILSRKSELRELREQVVALDRRSTDTERQLIELREQLGGIDERVATVQEEIDVLAEQAADLRTRIGQHRHRRDVLHDEVTLSRLEISGIETDIRTQEEAWQQARLHAEEADRLLQLLQTRIEQADREIHEREHERHERQQEVTTAKVALAKVEERVSALRAKHRQIEGDLESRRQEKREAERRLAGARQRLHESQCTMLRASAALAQLYLDKEKAERQVAELARERDLQRQERQLIAERAHAARAEWRTQQEQAHERELAVNDLRHRRDTLVERIREDYQLDLEALSQPKPELAAPLEEGENAEASADGTVSSDADRSPTSDIPVDPTAVNEEIEELKRKIHRLGAVNLDSLQELAELETRAGNLQTQYEDLIAAKKSLEEIINTINNDSRRLFTETFHAVRAHFQDLFRKLFGGGMADIVLEEDVSGAPVDILESGIEIIARPPGKELRSISLMSGGEKTLTAVALLLAIFRSKPSPFCILDEVDAALDEANIGRYTAVLREFLDRSQFIIITHSKKTMSSADVLYGITMQESGISKRVAVKFEDWPDDPPANGEASNGAAKEIEPGFAGR